VAGGQQAQTAAYVVSRTESALAAASGQGLVDSTRVTTSGGLRIILYGNATAIELSPRFKGGTSSAVWVYGQQDKFATYASSGQLASVYGIATAHQQWTGTSVDYQNRTWWQDTWATRRPFAPAPGCKGAEDGVDPFGQGGVDLAAALRTELSCGDYTMAGTHLVDGVEALELKSASSAGALRRQMTFWVDPATYLPVRSVTTLESPPIPGQAQLAGQVQIDYRWLAPTPANVAELHVTIPPGFTKVPASAPPF
jgi:hypothetical protein